MKISNKAGELVRYQPKRMSVIKSEYPIFFDVDGTLVIHICQTDPGPGAITVEDPITGSGIEVMPHNPNIRLLKEESHRGGHVVVWSRGGYEWATNVIKALKLEKYVDMVMTKPLTYVDDIDVSEWLKYRVYLEPDTNYKK